MRACKGTLCLRVTHNYQINYNIHEAINSRGDKFYYKSCNNELELASIVFDLANFVVGVINSTCIQYVDEKDAKERETFKRDADNFLKSFYSERVVFRKSLDDFSSIKFNAIINKKQDIYLITYITGSSQFYFENDLRRTIVNFEIALRSKFKHYIKERLSIVNNSSDGYHPERSSTIINLLKEKTTKLPINWSEKERILEYVN